MRTFLIVITVGFLAAVGVDLWFRHNDKQTINKSLTEIRDLIAVNKSEETKIQKVEIPVTPLVPVPNLTWTPRPVIEEKVVSYNTGNDHYNSFRINGSQVRVKTRVDKMGDGTGYLYLYEVASDNKKMIGWKLLEKVLGNADGSSMFLWSLSPGTPLKITLRSKEEPVWSNGLFVIYDKNTDGENDWVQVFQGAKVSDMSFFTYCSSTFDGPIPLSYLKKKEK